MLIKLLIALAICICMLSYSSGSSTIKNSINDKFIISNATILDKAIVSYYCNHHGHLPTTLDSDTLLVMGMKDIDLSHFTYTKVSDRSFVLKYNLNNGTSSVSAHSNSDLVIPPEVN